MVAPIQNPKLDTEIDLEFENSCNCLCCPTFIRRGSSPGKPATITAPPTPVGRHSSGRSFKFWGSSTKSVPPTPNNSPVPKVAESVTRAATPVFEEAEHK